MADSIFDLIFGENRFQPKSVSLIDGLNTLTESAFPVSTGYRKFLDIPAESRANLIQPLREKVEQMPTAPYDVQRGGFQGVLGSTEAEKIDGYSGSDPTDYDISGENISNTDKFVAESLLGTADLMVQPDVIGKELSDIGQGYYQKATGDITNKEQVAKADATTEAVKGLLTPEGFYKSTYETGGALALPAVGAYLGVKGAQLSKALYDKGIQPAMSVRDISSRKQNEITAPIDEYGFYDPIEQLLMDLPQEVNTPSDIKRYLMKRGIKRDQIAESKIDDYLQGKDRVTKEGLLNQINKEKTELVETTLMGEGFGEYGNALRIDNPEDEFPSHRRGGAEILRYRENLRNPSDRNWEAINDTDYIDSTAEDIVYTNSGSTFDEFIENQFTDTNQLALKLNKIDSKKYPLSDELKTKLENTTFYNVELNPKWINDSRNNILDETVPPEVLDELALDMAEEQYWVSPFYEWRVRTPDEQEEYKVIGNDEIGLTITDPYGRRLNEDLIYSLEEAEIRINDDAGEQGYLSYSDGGTQYQNYTGKADLDMDTYEEVLITAPNLGENYYGDHFEGYENTIAHLRMADTPDGKRKKVIEIQSDLHQEGRQTNYDTKEFRKKNAEDRKKLPDLEKEEQKSIDAYNKAQDEFFRNTQILSELAEDKGFKVDYDVEFDPNAKDLRGMTISRGNLYLHFLEGKLNRIHTGKGTTLTQSRQFGSMLGLDPSKSPFKGDWKLTSPDDLPPIKDEWKPIFETIKKDNELYNTRNDNNDRMRSLQVQINNIKYPTTVPDAPLKNERWVQNAVERAINKARQEGKEGVEFVDSEYSLDIWNPRRTKENGKVRYQELYQNVYDKKVPSVLKTYKNKYGGEVEKLDEGGYYYKFDDKSRDVKGIPLASTGGLLSIDQMQEDEGRITRNKGLLA